MKKNNPKLKFIFLAILLLGIFGLAESSQAVCQTPCTKSGTVWTCTDINQDCVQAAINESEVGWNAENEVRLGSGDVTWTDANQPDCPNPLVTTKSSLCMRRGIKLTGGVGGTTKITITGTNGRGALWFVPGSVARTANETLEVSGFTFDGLGENYSEGIVTFGNTGSTVMSGFKIHDNTFLNTYHAIGINGPSAGVIYNNIFSGVETAARNESAGSSWALWSPTYGTQNSVFFEDNTILAAPANGQFGTVGAGQGGSIVNRYNAVDMNGKLLDGNQWMDLHGLQSMTSAPGKTCGYDHLPDGCLPEVRSCGQWSQLRSEIYGNIYSNFYNPYSGYQEMMRLRGSGLLMFNNSITGVGTMPLPDIYEYSCDSCQSGTGPRYSMHVQNTYLWNNIGDNGIKTNLPIYVFQDNCGSYAVGTPYTIRENVDFWNYNADTLNGSTQKGINCGASAPTSDCSVGDGYWQTSYSPCYETPTNMEEMKVYTQSGKFYKCTAPDTWTEYYQPYTYPHPLRNESVLDTTPPSPPSGLAVS